MAKRQNKEIRLRGAPICWGVAIGIPYLYRPAQESLPTFKVRTDQIEGEIDRYRGAIQESEREIRDLRNRLKEQKLDESADILDTHLEIMKDPSLTSEIEERIRSSKQNPEHVFHQAINEYSNKFEQIKDPFFRERVGDLQDVANRILRRLQSSTHSSLLGAPEQCIVFADQLTPSQAAEAEDARIGGFVSRTGGDTSHSAIMARAKGIPYVSDVNFDIIKDYSDRLVIVDGRIGEVIINPTEETLKHYRALKEELVSHFEQFAKLSLYAAETVDGYQVSLSANVEMASEVDLIEKYGGDGIGLFRSEYICLCKECFPSEEEQFEVYREIAENLEGRSVVIRTFDIGGDKFPHLTGSKKEENPFLGCRAIRLMLKEHDAFCAQLRAILRASVYGDVRILLPMVSGLPELLEAKAHLEQAKEELRADGIPFQEKIPLGCMIEVPSAAITADALAAECDFFSIGTNDLVQYALAVDRDNEEMSYLYTPAHPAVLRLIRNVIAEANQKGIPVSICGEMAADPHFTALLLGLGIQELSVSARYLPIIKNAIRSTSVIKASRLAEHVLEMPTAVEIMQAVTDHYREASLATAIKKSEDEDEDEEEANE